MRLALNIVMQNDGNFVDVILLYATKHGRFLIQPPQKLAASGT